MSCVNSEVIEQRKGIVSEVAETARGVGEFVRIGVAGACDTGARLARQPWLAYRIWRSANQWAKLETLATLLNLICIFMR